MLCSHKDLILFHLAVEQSQWSDSTAESGSLYIFFPMDLLSMIIMRGKFVLTLPVIYFGFWNTNGCF